MSTNETVPEVPVTPEGRRAYVLGHLERQWSWFNKHANNMRTAYLTVKTVEIVLAAAVPVAAAVDAPAVITGGLGALIVVLVGSQQLFQFHDSWIRYRTAEAGLRRERYLFRSDSGGYEAAADPIGLLAERMDAIVSAEAANWAKAFAPSHSDSSTGSTTSDTAHDET